MAERTYYSADAEQRARRERSLIAILFLLLGTGIGVILALLFAPDEGQQLRGRLSSAVDNGLEQSRGVTQTTLDQLEDKYADLRRYVEDALSKVRS